MTGKGESQIRNPKFEIMAMDETRMKHGLKIVLHPCLNSGSLHSSFKLLDSKSALGFFLLAAASSIGCFKDAKTTFTEKPLTIITKGGVEMVLLPTGSFQMGSGRGQDDEKPSHTVTLAAFLMDKYEVTQAEFEKYQLPNPSHFKGPKLPVEQVTWAQAAVYCNARSKAEGLTPCYNEDTAECDFQADGYRLPTEAEWEYACKAGNLADTSSGFDSRTLGDFAWFTENSEKKTHPVGEKRPNAWGLYDMQGNVAEWCNDIYDKNYYTNSPADNPRGPKEGKLYVLRGGSWKSAGDACRSSYRLGENPGFSDACLARDAIGFRCVRKANSSVVSSP
jgi:formylglycine-generating enzyme required for sulfatase activity